MMSIRSLTCRVLLCALVAGLGFGSPAHAQDSDAPVAPETADKAPEDTTKAPEKPITEVPFYKGDNLRFDQADIFKRTGATLLGSVLEIGSWDQESWLWAGSTAAVTIALMAPTDPSPDVRFQDWVQGGRTAKADKYLPPLRTPAFRTYGMGTIGLLGLYGHFGNKPKVLEAASLSMEAVTVAVTLHLAQKLIIGREGPTDGDGLGIIHGPTEGINLYPAGTPSGHTASVWAMSVVLMDQVDTWWGDTLGWTVNSYVAVSLIYNDQHYVSDIIWGAPLGYFVGKWVSKHRSTKYAYQNGHPIKLGQEPKRVKFSGISPLNPDEYGTRGIAGVWVF